MARRKKKSKRVTDIDLAASARLRKRRQQLGISQTALATALGLTFQQIQKNETGVNRLTADRLWRLSGLLNVPLGYFFKDAPPQPEPLDGRP